MDKNGKRPSRCGWDQEEEMERMEELYKKDLNEPDYDNGVLSHPEPDILECKVQWALRSTAVNKASGYNEIPAELFKIPKGWGHQGFAFIMSTNLEDPAVATGLEKVNP